MPERRVPEGGYIMVDFRHQRSFSKSLHDCGERDDAPTTERLDEESVHLILSPEPCSNVGDQPSLTTRVSKRAALRDRCDVHRGDWRGRYGARFRWQRRNEPCLRHRPRPAWQRHHATIPPQKG